MNARYYVPGIGRFASADSLVPSPADPQSLNRYSYVYNNPINATDPSGHCPLCVVLILGGTLLLRADTNQDPLPIVTSYSGQFISVAQNRSIDPVVLAAVVSHESGAIERFFGSWGENALLRLYPDPFSEPSEFSSIGVSQNQLRMAQFLEEQGYIARQPNVNSRINALFDTEQGIDYAGAHLQYLKQSISTWSLKSNGEIDADTLNRLSILAYNIGWDDPLSNGDMLDQLKMSEDVPSLISGLMGYGYVSQQVFAPNRIRTIENILGVRYEPQ